MWKYLVMLFSVLLLASCGKNIEVQTTTGSDQKNVILALGDSLTAGLGLPEQDSYPAQLERRLSDKSYNYRIINAGISGDTSAGLLSRIDWVLDGEAPSLAILCIGANDAFQGKSVEEIEKNIRAIIERIESKNIPILFAGMKAPLNLGDAYGRSYEALFPKLAKEYKLPFIPFFLKDVALRAEYNQEDRIHPTASGYAIVADHVFEALVDNHLIVK